MARSVILNLHICRRQEYAVVIEDRTLHGEEEIIMNILNQIDKIDGLLLGKGGQSKDSLISLAQTNSAGLGLAGKVTWNQTSPWAMTNDSDFDGIPDALDNTLGPGA